MGKRIQFTSPSSGAASPVSNNPGILLPWGTQQISAASGNTIQGAVNQQQQLHFVSPITIALGHVTFFIGTPNAAGLFGVSLYSGDGLTKLSAADGVSLNVAANSAVRAALSAGITLQANIDYWLGWTCNDGTTATFSNYLDVAARIGLYNTGGVLRYGRNTTDATAGGVTLSSIRNTVSTQLRIVDLFFDA